jgi:hypothetical protein
LESLKDFSTQNFGCQKEKNVLLMNETQEFENKIYHPEFQTSSSKDLAIFLEDERRVQEEILNQKALRMNELESMLVKTRQAKIEKIPETPDNKIKLNLLNIINNDKIANQSGETKTSDNSSGKLNLRNELQPKDVAKLSRNETTRNLALNSGTICTDRLDREVLDSYNVISKKTLDNRNYRNDQSFGLTCTVTKTKQYKRRYMYKQQAKIKSNENETAEKLLSNKKMNMLNPRIYSMNPHDSETVPSSGHKLSNDYSKHKSYFRCAE